MLDLVPLFLHLVATDHQLEVVGLQEILSHVPAERDPDAALRRCAAEARLGIAPQQLGHQAFVGWLTVAVDLPDLVQRHAVARKQTSMHNKNLAVDAMAQGQYTERLAKELVEVLVVLLGDLALETVELVHVSRLVVASGEIDAGGAKQFPREHNQYYLNRERSTVHEIPVEDVRVVLCGIPVDLPDVQKIVILPMDVSAHRNPSVVWHVYVDDGWQSFQQRKHVHHDCISALPGQGLLVLLPLHELLAELSGDLPALVDGARVRAVDGHAAHVDGLANGLCPVTGDCAGEDLLLADPLALLQLRARVLVIGRELAQLSEILQGILVPPQRHVSRASSVPSLREIFLGLDGLRRVEEGCAVAFHLDMAERPVRKIYLDGRVLRLGSIIQGV
mmetsp:Transcript_61071/g.158536  ORF Transcript_61071/g.158536 Transcript_61071/m.158536 type:complete len:391 (+) Transcript_61071:340-1512(+)